MKRTALILAAISLATSAAAGNSDRYHDLRLNTAIPGAERPSSHNEGVSSTSQVAVFSSKSSDSSQPYAYQHRFGVGPNNDSR